MQYLKKEGSDEVDFLPENKHQASLQVNATNFGGHDQSCPKSRSNKFAKPSQYLKKEVCDEVTFCADKHQSFIQAKAMIFNECDQACRKYLR